MRLYLIPVLISSVLQFGSGRSLQFSSDRLCLVHFNSRFLLSSAQFRSIQFSSDEFKFSPKEQSMTSVQLDYYSIPFLLIHFRFPFQFNSFSLPSFQFLFFHCHSIQFRSNSFPSLGPSPPFNSFPFLIFSILSFSNVL